MTRETVGKVAHDLLLKQPDTDSPIEQMRESLTEYEQNLLERVEDGKKKYISDFFVVVITKRERLMTNVMRNYFFHRISCPTPQWDQAVYSYSIKDDELEFLWVIPSRDACEHLRNNALYVHPDERELLGFVLDFYDGTLDKLAKSMNGEMV
jgi:hypothetical protein